MLFLILMSTEKEGPSKLLSKNNVWLAVTPCGKNCCLSSGSQWFKSGEDAFSFLGNLPICAQSQTVHTVTLNLREPKLYTLPPNTEIKCNMRLKITGNHAMSTSLLFLQEKEDGSSLEGRLIENQVKISIIETRTLRIQQSESACFDIPPFSDLSHHLNDHLCIVKNARMRQDGVIEMEVQKDYIIESGTHDTISLTEDLDARTIEPASGFLVYPRTGIAFESMQGRLELNPESLMDISFIQIGKRSSEKFPYTTTYIQ